MTTASLTLFGLEDAQQKFVKEQNESFRRYPDTTPESSVWNFYGEAVESHTASTVERYQRGERVQAEAVKDVPVEDRILYMLSNQTTNGEPQAFHLALTFPALLVESAERLAGGHLSVSVSTFENGRENGFVYTIMEPNGVLRSFSVYTHRGSDSIVINGCTNWDGESLPYAGGENGSSYDFYAEISSEQYEQAADALLFFLREAARGELDDSEALVAKAEHLDWTAILSAQMPAFAEWAERQGFKAKNRLAE